MLTNDKLIDHDIYSTGCHNYVINDNIELQGSGDNKALMLILAAESAISALVGPIEKNESIIGNYEIEPFNKKIY